MWFAQFLSTMLKQKFLLILPLLLIAQAGVAANTPSLLEQYLYEEPFSRVFGKPNTDTIHDFQDRLFKQALKKGVYGPRPDPVLMVGNSFHFADQADIIKDLLLHPKMREEAIAFTQQMAVIERLIKAQGIAPINIQTEQFLQLTDNVFQIGHSKDFEFIDHSEAEELTGRTTKRNSLLRYPAFLLQFLIGRKFMTGQRVDNRDYFETFKSGLFAQPIFHELAMDETKQEINQWLDRLNKSANYYDTLSNPDFEGQLSLKSWVAMATAIESF